MLDKFSTARTFFTRTPQNHCVITVGVAHAYRKIAVMHDVITISVAVMRDVITISVAKIIRFDS